MFIFLEKKSSENSSAKITTNLLTFLLFLLPFTCMTLKGVFGYLCAIIFLLAVWHLISHKTNKKFFKQRYSLLITFSLFAIFLSVLTSQFARNDYELQSYDGPSRLILSLPILICLFQLKIDFVKILSNTLPLALLSILTYALIYPSNFHPSRLTNYYLDPIIWGNLSIILGFLCLASLKSTDMTIVKFYKFFGFFLGITMSILSQSRAGWLAGFFMGAAWLVSNKKNMSAKKIFLGLFLGLCAIIIGYLTINILRYRIDTAFVDIINWVNHTNINTSIGIRLTMWKISWHLFTLNPVLGYGEFSKLPVLNDPYILSFADDESIKTILCCGPHNELAARMLQSGILGVSGLLATYLIPIFIFIKSKNHPSSLMGITLCIGMLIGGISGEMLSLKFSYNFFAILISGLLATNLWHNNEQT